MELDSFKTWAEYFIANAKFHTKDYSVLVCDGHYSHTFNYDALKLLNENKTLAVCIPAHSSHLFNVADVAVFANLKKAFRSYQVEYKREKSRNVVFNDFPFLFRHAWENGISQNAITAGKHYLNQIS